MKNIIKSTIYIVFLALIFANFSIFASSISISQKITYYESESQKLHQENIELERQAYEVNSLQHIASEAANLQFTQQTKPMYIDNLKVARLP